MRAAHLVVLSSALLALVVLGCGGGPIPVPADQRGGAAAPRADGAESVRVRRLLIAFAGAEGADAGLTRTREQALERATMIAGLARADSSFVELVTRYGDTPPDRDDRSAVRVLVRGSDDWPDALEHAALRLDVGQVTNPVETPAGFVVLRREADPEAVATGPSEVGARHILVSFRGAQQASADVTRTREEARALALQISEDARATPARWVELHSEHSDEPGSPEGGDLGTFGRGQMVPAFERAAFALGVSDVSAPVESPFGFHVIQRTE